VEILRKTLIEDSSTFEILRIINYFLDEDAEWRLQRVIGLVGDQRSGTFKEGTLGE